MEYLTDDDYQTAKLNGISRERTHERFYTYGWSKQRAITEPLNSGGLWGKYKAICEKSGISESTFYKRVERGISADKASTMPTTRKLTTEQITAAAQNGIGIGTLRNRIYNCKWNIEDAVSKPVDVRYRSKAL